MRLTFKILIVLFILAVTVSANVNAPTSWGRGYKLYNVNGSYWDLMGESGIQNGTLEKTIFENGSLRNVTNVTIKSPNSVNASAIVSFSGTSITFNNSINASEETYSFINGSAYALGSRLINITGNQTNMTVACSNFVTEVNLNSSNFTASTCSGNATTLTSKWPGTGNNSFTLSTNASSVTVPATFSGGANRTTSYIDASGSSDVSGDQDIVYRSTDTTGALGEIFRINVNTAPGSRIVFTEIVIPTSRPSNPVNGSVRLNQTAHDIEVYDNGSWYLNGTVV